MADVLSQIPGLAGYLAMENQRRQAAMADLKGVSGLASLLQQQREAALQEQMAPLKMQALQAQVQAAQAQAAERATREEFFRNTDKYRIPGQPAVAPGQGVTGGMDEGGLAQILGVGPTEQGAPAARPATEGGFDLNRMVYDMAAKGLISPDVLLKNEEDRAARVAQTQANIEQRRENAMMLHESRMAQARTAEEKAAETARHNLVMENIARMSADSLAAVRSLAGSRPGPTITSADGIFERMRDGTLRRVVNPETGEPLRPASIINQDRVDTRRLRDDLTKASKPSEDALRTYDRFVSFVETGDNAQSMQLAAAQIMQLARSNNTRFKGEAEKILGTGFGGGSIDERIGNFVSQFSTGTPTAETQQRLAKLANAAATAAASDLADTYKRTYQRAVADGLDPIRVIGRPRVIGNIVITPNGEMSQFKSRKAAQDAATKWLNEHLDQGK